MKKKIFFIGIVIATMCLAGCEKQIEDHQPKDPSTWSPIGKDYGYVYTDSLGNKLTNHHVYVYFMTDTTYTYVDFGHKKRCWKYILDYPAITLLDTMSYYDNQEYHLIEYEFEKGYFIDTFSVVINGQLLKSDWYID